MKTQIISMRHDMLKTIIFFSVLVFLTLMTTAVNAQSKERTVSGIVKSHDGPVPYASVTLKGTTVGIATDENGAFTFPKKLKENDILLVSFLGYEDDEIPITENTSIVTPFLEDIPLIIVAALRCEPSVKKKHVPEN